MNLIEKIIYEIENQVPHELINLLFMHPKYRYDNSSLANKIEENYIRPKFIYDLDTNGGTQEVILMSNVYEVFRDDTGITFRVIDGLLGDKRITSILGMTSIGGMSQTVMTSEIENNYNKLANAFSSPHIYTTSDLELVGKNTFKLTTQSPFYNSGFALRVIVNNDENLNNFHPRHYPYIYEAAVVGFKAFLYNKMIISINRNELQLGHSLDIIRSLIEDYRDAQKEYDELMLGKVKRVQVINDGVSYNRLLKLNFPR